MALCISCVKVCDVRTDGGTAEGILTVRMDL